MKFNQILNQLRKENDITAKKLADELNFSVNLVYEWEKGRCEPSLDTLNSLANFFDVSVDYLIGREDELGNKILSPELPNASERKLSKAELELLSLFDSLSPFARDSMLVQIRALADQSEKDKVK